MEKRRQTHSFKSSFHEAVVHSPRRVGKNGTGTKKKALARLDKSLFVYNYN